MCNCNKPRPRPSSGSGSSSNTQSFALEVNGKTQTFGSKLERDAEFVRSGRRGRLTSF